MATNEEVWNRAKTLYCTTIHNTRKISSILAHENMVLSHVAIYNRAKKEQWIKGKEVFEEEIMLKEPLIEPQESDAPEDEAPIDRARITLTQAVTGLSNIVLKALKLKEDIVDRTQQALTLHQISEVTASRILSNLGLNAINVSKMLGVSTDDNLTKSRNEKDVTESQIKIYLPSNGRV